VRVEERQHAREDAERAMEFDLLDDQAYKKIRYEKDRRKSAGVSA
jgi:hypothetical protein